jgi:tetraacyldisaccharide 4'-kinase
MQIVRLLLLPFSVLYGAVLWLRNQCYNRGWLPSSKGALPAIVVGNIAVGGTGKTPHALWLANALSDLHPAILSRGYKRRTKGFRYVTNTDTPALCGDEPLLYANAMPELTVAVCEDRLLGLRSIAADGRASVVILDDAMQHRKLIPDFSIALIRSDELPWNDDYLPAGRLRDHRSRLRQADAILVTHVNAHDHPPERREGLKNTLRQRLKLPGSTIIGFSQTHYPPLRHVAGPQKTIENAAILLVTGIAQPAFLVSHLKATGEGFSHMRYADHHTFTEREAHDWERYIELHPEHILVTTAKDWIRIKILRLSPSIPIYIQDMEVSPDDADLIVSNIRAAVKRTGRGSTKP